MRKLLIIISLILGFTACKHHTVITTDSGMIVYPTNTKPESVRISFTGEEIVRVEISANGEFDPASSLIDAGNIGRINFEVANENDFAVAKSGKLIVKVNRTSGEVLFYDKDNNLILEEDGGMRKMLPVTVDNENGYSTQVSFKSSEEEALYGLGQHQADDMNYKGKNEELFQYNTKVSIPFIISTKNYGILWDNYSLTRFGDPRPYSNLDVLKLYDKDSREGGLTATYIDEPVAGGVFLERNEKRIDYENLETISAFPEGFDFNDAKITWEGYLEAEKSGLHRFLCYYAGYTKLWIDGELQFDKWRTAWNPSVAKFNVDMQSGVKHHLKLEWIPDGGVSYIGLKVLTPVDEATQNQITFSSEMGTDIRYYFIAGDNMDEVISGYRTITGKAQVMPKWSMGFWQSRERYKTQDELLDVLAEYRKRKIPIDNIVLDWSHWPVDQWGSHQFDAARFPDPAGMVSKVHENNAKIMVSVWPKFYINTEHYRQYDEQGWMYRRAVEDSIRDWIYPGYIGSFYDAYNEDARKLFWDQLRDNYYILGFDAWWLDATEPDILSNASIEYRKALMHPTALGSATKYFNAYALMNAKGIYEGQRSLNKNERVFILTRSGFSGIQRYGAVTWSGDIGTRWEDMKSQISAGINFSMSGLPYWTMDIGGFCVEKRYERATEGSEDMNEWRELNTRWFQFGAFVPLFRSHGQYPFREIFNISNENHEAFKSMVYYDKLRYRLMPYIYSLAGWTYLKDYTIMRGLAMDFSADSRLWNIGDQYMFGPSLLVNPVYEYKRRTRIVYLPESAGWYNVHTGDFFDGGQEITTEAPYDRMPLFVKAGSILPFGPEMEYTTQKPAEPLTIFLYTGADAQFDLYEDEGENYNYEHGKFTIIPFEWAEDSGEFKIGRRTGEFEGMLSNRTVHVHLVSPDRPVSIDTNAKPDYVINYTGEEVSTIL